MTFPFFIVKDCARTIVKYLAPHLAPRQSLLEIGAGDGLVAQALRRVVDIDIKLVDVVDYNRTDLVLDLYDGQSLPFPSASFDYSLLIFVLHHTPDPLRVLCEALRVSRRGVLLVENDVQGWLRKRVTRWVDSVPHLQRGVPICYHTLTLKEWNLMLARLPVRAELLARFTMDGFWRNLVIRIDKIEGLESKA